MIATKTEQREAKGKALALGLVVATLMVMCLLLAVEPAHAATTFTVNSTGDSGDQTPRRWLVFHGRIHTGRSGPDDSQPALSPNGAKIAFTSTGARPSNPEGDNEIYTMSADGSNQRPPTKTGSAAADIDPAWARKR